MQAAGQPPADSRVNIAPTRRQKGAGFVRGTFTLNVFALDGPNFFDQCRIYHPFHVRCMLAIKRLAGQGAADQKNRHIVNAELRGCDSKSYAIS